MTMLTAISTCVAGTIAGARGLRSFGKSAFEALRRFFARFVHSTIAYFLLHLPVALATLWLLIDHHAAMAALGRMYGAGGAPLESIISYLAAIFVGLALLNHATHAIVDIARMPAAMRTCLVAASEVFVLLLVLGVG